MLYSGSSPIYFLATYKSVKAASHCSQPLSLSCSVPPRRLVLGEKLQERKKNAENDRRKSRLSDLEEIFPQFIVKS